jgi:threonine-phosphate decarboxylase
VKEQAHQKAVHGGMIKQVRENTGRAVLDFSANLNPAPPSVIPDLSLECLSYYPDDGYTRLKEVISAIFNRPVEEIAVGNGSIELIRVFCFATLSRGDRVRISPPTFGEYELSAKLAGAVLAGPDEPAKVTFVCNPNNPTGELMPRSRMLEVQKHVSAAHGMLFVDEAFIELSDPGESVTDIREDGLFVLRSLTKSFAVPGIRFGYGFGSPSLIETVETLRPPWSVNAFAEQYALAAFRHYGNLEESRKVIARERKWLVHELSRFPFTIHPSSANFLLLNSEKDVSDLCTALLARDILVRDCHSFGLPKSIRIAVRTREENQQLIEALEQCLP